MTEGRGGVSFTPNRVTSFIDDPFIHINYFKVTAATRLSSRSSAETRTAHYARGIARNHHIRRAGADLVAQMRSIMAGYEAR